MRKVTLGNPNHKHEVASLKQKLRDLNVKVDVSTDGHLRSRRRLAEIEFETVSPCRNVAVWMTAGGALADLAIADEALDRFDHQQLASRLTAAIQQADRIATDAVESHMRAQEKGRISR